MTALTISAPGFPINPLIAGVAYILKKKQFQSLEVVDRVRHNKFEQDKCKTFQVIVPTRSNF